jgi:hypothetical protein
MMRFPSASTCAGDGKIGVTREANMSELGDGVYVSYSWSAEKDQPLAMEIGEALRAAGLDFHRDEERIGYGDSIKKFMDELGAAGNIVALLSPAYFLSEYCMYELLSVWKNGNFSSRLHPIRLETLALDDADFQLEIIGCWKNKAEELRAKLASHDPAATLDLKKREVVCAEIYKEIGEVMAFLAGINSLSLQILRAQQFLPLIERIRPSPKTVPYVNLANRTNDSVFLDKLKADIHAILCQHSNLHDIFRAIASSHIQQTEQFLPIGVVPTRL